MEYKCLSDFLFKGENKNINISVSKNSPVNASLSLDGYKHSMVQIIALTIALKMKTVIIGCQAFAEFSSYTTQYKGDPVHRDSHHIQTEPLVLHESGNSNYLCPDYSPTVFLSRNSTCCIRLACLEHTFPLAHPNLQSSIFFRDARK